jgi:hypothetical protein
VKVNLHPSREISSDEWKLTSEYMGATMSEDHEAYAATPEIDDLDVWLGELHSAIHAWLFAAGITDGPVFVKLAYGKLTRQPLTCESYINEIVARVADRAGLEVKRIAPHRAFRASPITAAAHADENPALISKRARHKSFETTKKYIDRNAGDDVRVGRAAY